MQILDVAKQAQVIAQQWVKDKLFYSGHARFFEAAFVAAYQDIPLTNIMFDVEKQGNDYAKHVTRLGYEAGKEFKAAVESDDTVNIEAEYDSNVYDAEKDGGRYPDLVYFLAGVDEDKKYLIINNAHCFTPLAAYTLYEYLVNFIGSVQINGDVARMHKPLSESYHVATF